MPHEIINRVTLPGKWKQVFSISPAQYILDLKLEAAARFLLETDLPISAIVREIHYCGTTPFHRHFSQKYGMTPDQYRRGNR